MYFLPSALSVAARSLLCSCLLFAASEVGAETQSSSMTPLRAKIAAFRAELRAELPKLGSTKSTAPRPSPSAAELVERVLRVNQLRELCVQGLATEFFCADPSITLGGQGKSDGLYKPKLADVPELKVLLLEVSKTGKLVDTGTKAVFRGTVSKGMRVVRPDGESAESMLRQLALLVPRAFANSGAELMEEDVEELGVLTADVLTAILEVLKPPFQRCFDENRAYARTLESNFEVGAECWDQLYFGNDTMNRVLRTLSKAIDLVVMSPLLDQLGNGGAGLPMSASELREAARYLRYVVEARTTERTINVATGREFDGATLKFRVINLPCRFDTWPSVRSCLEEANESSALSIKPACVVAGTPLPLKDCRLVSELTNRMDRELLGGAVQMFVSGFLTLVSNKHLRLQDLPDWHPIGGFFKELFQLRDAVQRPLQEAAEIRVKLSMRKVMTGEQSGWLLDGFSIE